MWAVCDWLKISFSFDEPKPPGEDSDVVIILNSMRYMPFLIIKKRLKNYAMLLYNHVDEQLFL